MAGAADRIPQAGTLISGLLSAGAGVLAGSMLLFAVSAGDDRAAVGVVKAETPPVRQAIISLPEPDPVWATSRDASTSAALLPPKPAAAEMTRRIEAGLPLSDPKPVKVAIRKPAPVPVDNRPRIALVIDDMGFDRVNSALAVKLPATVTLSYLPNAPDVQRQVRVARLRGHPVMLHLPMETPSHRGRPGVNVLALKGSEQILRERMIRLLGSFDGYIGVNNHMGSRFTRDAGRMEIVVSELRRRGLFFVDSRPSNRSVGGETERLARCTVSAIAIAHPRTSTMELLGPWVRNLDDRGFRLVPVTDLLKRPPVNKLAQLQLGE